MGSSRDPDAPRNATIEAAGQLGLPFLPDISTPNRQGIGYSQASVGWRGRQASTYRMVLKPAMTRPNLTVITGALVKRIELTGGRVMGVRCRPDGRSKSMRSRHDVIIAAGDDVRISRRGIAHRKTARGPSRSPWRRTRPTTRRTCARISWMRAARTSRRTVTFRCP
ncbi:MAG: GMC family oxidoreductase N-terminal domain-containing protein [Gammaproteobacteria bacterium]|nr:GMC family oxidoreductase N-terminal domain-containing protein [Gammaproteobacteria bacterium]